MKGYTGEQTMMTAAELAIAYAESQLAGHIKYSEDGEGYTLTPAGLEAVFRVWFGLSPKDRLSLFHLIKLVIEAGEEIQDK